MLKEKQKLITLLSLVVSILLITTGLSFAYFTATITGVESDTTILAKSGIMNIDYDGGPNIDAEGLTPSNEPFGIKNFTVAGKVTTLEDLKYHIVLVIEENTFTESAIKYKLNSENTDDNGEVEPSSEVYVDIPSGVNQELLVGNGYYESPSEDYAVHTYNLELYFLETGIPQNEDQDKIIKAYVQIREGYKEYIPTLATDDDFEWLDDISGYYVMDQPKKGYYKYIGESKGVIIPHEIYGHPMTNYYQMFEYSDVETVVSTNPNITSIRKMFNFGNSETLDLSNFDTSNVTDMSGLFVYNGATSIDLSGFDTSNVTSMYYMFDYSQATSLDLSNFNTSKVENMSIMFRRCEATSLDLSNFDTSNVTNMSVMFKDSRATNIILGDNFNTGKVTDMSSMFEYSLLETIDLSNFNTSNVTDMRYMFNDSNFKSLDLSSFDTSNVTKMRSMFRGVEVKNLDLSTFNTEKVTTMNTMFEYNKATTLDLSSFDTSKVTDMDSMFRGTIADPRYARTQDDAAKFNSSSNYSGVSFVVKP